MHRRSGLELRRRFASRGCVSTLSIIIPVLNEAEHIVSTLEALAPLRRRGVEVIVVDSGSSDATVPYAQPLADRVISAPRGRALQMNAGAAIASGEILLFLHADTALPEKADRLVLDALGKSRRVWGRFDVRIQGRAFLAIVATLMNIRSRLTGIATGDQAMFVRREAFVAVDGFPDIPLMEDIALSRRLKQRGRPLCLSHRVTTSGRRWEQHGVARTILLMWRLRLAYFFGAEPGALARQYGYAPRER
jgi:rSAM/selenodomain-associated transferase 2